MFVAYNRVEFTQRSFGWLIANTDWSLVDRLVVYDDGSEPRARLWLQDACSEVEVIPVDFRVRSRRWGSPVAVMVDYLKGNGPDWFVKIDNDIAMPTGWLNDLLAVSADHPDASLIGMEAGMTRVRGRDGNDPDERPTFEPSTHIGGIGLMRRAAFDQPGVRLKALGSHYGFTEWQHRHKNVVRGWITPDLQCPLLDRLPFEPYLGLSQTYREQRWQRDWPTYDPVWMRWAFDWILEAEEEVA